MFMGSALLPLYPLQLFICSLVGIRTSTDGHKGYILVLFDGMSSKWKQRQRCKMCFSHTPQQQSKQSNFSFHTLWITSINAAFVCSGLFTGHALNPWIIIIFYFSLSLSRSRVTFTHLLRSDILASIAVSITTFTWHRDKGLQFPWFSANAERFHDWRLKTWQTTRGAV